MGVDRLAHMDFRPLVLGSRFEEDTAVEEQLLAAEGTGLSEDRNLVEKHMGHWQAEGV